MQAKRFEQQRVAQQGSDDDKDGGTRLEPVAEGFLFRGRLVRLRFRGGVPDQFDRNKKNTQKCTCHQNIWPKNGLEAIAFHREEVVGNAEHDDG